jgi:cellulose synthase/poly-beta-1,6-N-acetylglucosamine synthase-like glycosyltransferase
MYVLVFFVGALLTFSFVFAVYLSYFFLVLKNRGLTAKFQNELSLAQSSNNPLPPVSIIVNAFNESGVIARKLGNISELNYPLDKLEVLVIDDASTDGTGDIAKNAMVDFNLSGRVVENQARLGLNRSLNVALAQAKHSIVCITDSDVMLEKESLRRSVNVLMNVENAGGVTGNVRPLFEGNGVAQLNESAYRGFYHKAMLGEASIHSAFPGNGPLIVYDKSLVPSPIPVDYGSTDGNVAMNIVKSGHRFVYIPNAVILEPVPENIGQQRLQKVRRAQRLIQVFLHNTDVFLNKKYGKFGQIVFPLKFLMVVVCPLLMLLGLSLFVVSFVFSSNFLFQGFSVGGVIVVSCVALVWTDFAKMFSSFVFHQIYLLIGLVFSVRKSKFWKVIDRKKFEK